MLFRSVGIVGVGLIGGSIALTLKGKKSVRSIVGVDINEDNLSRALELGIIDEKCGVDCISKCDVVVVSTPVSTISKYVVEVLKLNKDTVVLDVGSVKKPIVDHVLKEVGNGANYIPMHPIAGTENFGPEAAFDGLFEKAFCIITPYEGMDKGLLDFGKDFAQELGMIVKVMTPELHDEVFGYVSHLPHVIAYTLVHLVSEKPEEFGFVGGGFRDYTRVAASSEIMWSDIFLMNKNNVLKAIDEYMDRLRDFKDIVEEEEKDELIKYLRQARVFKGKLDGKVYRND